MNMSLGEWLIWANAALSTAMIAAPMALLNEGMNWCVSIVGVGAVREPPLQAFIPRISNAAPISDISKGVIFRKCTRIKNILRNIITFSGILSSVIFFTALKSY
jgi:hypothetical protein